MKENLIIAAIMWHQSRCFFEEIIAIWKTGFNGYTVITSEQLFGARGEHGGVTNSINHTPALSPQAQDGGFVP